MGGAALERPVLHGVGNDTGNLGVETASLVNGFVKGFIGFLRETLVHDSVVKHIDPEILINEGHSHPTFQSLIIISLEEKEGSVKRINPHGYTASVSCNYFDVFM